MQYDLIITLKNRKKLEEYFLKRETNKTLGRLDYIELSVISLLNCIGKVIEKVVAEHLFLFYKKFSKLHPGQMGGRKKRSAIDAVAILVHTV